MSGTVDYVIASYDPESLALLKVAGQTLSHFLALVHRRPNFEPRKRIVNGASVRCVECTEDASLRQRFEQLGRKEENGFDERLCLLWLDVRKFLGLSGCRRPLLITSRYIGPCVGLSNGVAIVSPVWVDNDLETFTTGILHELGHMHGLPNERRERLSGEYRPDPSDTKEHELRSLENADENRNRIYEFFGTHCLNPGCAMRQRKRAHNWRKHLTEDRLKTGRVFCGRCQSDLLEFFRREGI